MRLCFHLLKKAQRTDCELFGKENLWLQGTRLNVSQTMKYPGVILDRKLTWNVHRNHTILKAKSSLIVTRYLIGQEWGSKTVYCSLDIHSNRQTSTDVEFPGMVAKSSTSYKMQQTGELVTAGMHTGHRSFQKHTYNCLRGFVKLAASQNIHVKGETGCIQAS